jgi:hypothetical protein
VSQPPTVGPIDGANVAVSPNSAMPIGCCDFGRRVRTMTMAVGIRAPPVKPWPARNRIIWLRSVDSAQATEKPTNKSVLVAR